MNFNSPANKLLRVESYAKLVHYWDFFLEGLTAVRNDSQDNMPGVGNEEFFKTLISLATGERNGTILLLTSKNGKPLGYMVLIDVTLPYGEKTINCYLAYTNRKCPSTMQELRFEGERWSRENGFKRLQAISYRVKPMPRLSGAIRRYFNRTLGLRERCVVFEAEIV